MILCHRPDKGTFKANGPADESGLISCPSHLDGVPLHAVPVGTDINHPYTCHGWRIYYRPDAKAAN